VGPAPAPRACSHGRYSHYLTAHIHWHVLNHSYNCTHL
jgi:hypothetical protein